jgi:hypothetical protein
MTRTTRNIVLGLVSSAAIFGCCFFSCVDQRNEEVRDANGRVVGHHRRYHYSPWPFWLGSGWGHSSGYGRSYGPGYGRSYSTPSRTTSGQSSGGSHTTTGASSRGGFGGTGHATTGG